MGEVLRIVIAVLLLMLAGPACARAIVPGGVEDAQIGARVKTALVNDPEIGTRPIEVRVIGGVVRLTGQVESKAHIERAVSLSRGVPGVTDVVSELRIGDVEIAPATTTDQQDAFTEEEREPGLLAVGVSLRRSAPAEEALGGRLSVGPLVRFGSGGGLGPALGFGWFEAAWNRQSAGSPLLARIRVRPVMGGVSYGLLGERQSVSFSIVAGMAFNSLSLPANITPGEIPLTIGNSLAVRPGVSLWLDLDRRIAINLSGGYLMTRPRLRVLHEGQIRTRALRADAILINAGIVYKIF